MKIAIAFVVATAAWLAAASAAGAAGYLNELGCLGPPGSACATIDSARVLGPAAQVLISPDARYAYAITSTLKCSGTGCEPDAITALRRGSDGELSMGPCISSSTARGCAGLPGQATMSALGTAVISPDAHDLYVPTFYGESIDHFRIGAGGAASYADCIGDPDHGCTAMPDQEGLGQLTQIAIGADGADLYAITSDNTVIHLRRGAGGALSAADCAGWSTACTSPPLECNRPSPPCLPAMYYTQPRTVAVAPDGRDVYVGYGADSTRWGAIARYRRRADGSISYADCYGTDVIGCRPAPAGNQGLSGPNALALSADGTQMYVAGGVGDGAVAGSDAIVHLVRHADGELDLVDCAGTADAGCSALPSGVRALAGTQSVALSPDGQSLYSGAWSDETLAHYAIGAGGALSFAGCASSSWASTEGCRPGDGSGGAVAVSGDGRNVYGGGSYVLPTYDRTLSAPPAATGPAPTVTDVRGEGDSTTTGAMHATIDPHGQPVNVVFEYGETTAYGEVTKGFSTSQTGPPWTVTAGPIDLAPATTYHFRVVVTSPGGTVRSADQTLTTQPWPGSARSAPRVETSGAGGATQTAVRLEGYVDPAGTPTTVHFEWGPTTAYGNATPAIGVGDGTARRFFTQMLSGLRPATEYHLRIVATNAGGTSYGSDQPFGTAPDDGLPVAPLVEAGCATAVGRTTATVTGVVNPYGQPVDYHFEYSDTPLWRAGDVISTTSRSAGSGSDDETVSTTLTGLAADTTYYFRVVAGSDVQAPERAVTTGGDPTCTTSAPPPSPPPATTTTTTTTTPAAPDTNAAAPPGAESAPSAFTTLSGSEAPGPAPPAATIAALAPRRLSGLATALRGHRLVVRWHATRAGTTVVALSRLARGRATRLPSGERHHDRPGTNAVTLARRLRAGRYLVRAWPLGTTGRAISTIVLVTR